FFWPNAACFGLDNRSMGCKIVAYLSRDLLNRGNDVLKRFLSDVCPPENHSKLNACTLHNTTVERATLLLQLLLLYRAHTTREADRPRRRLHSHHKTKGGQ
ncbi:unnamed protein product, partial [Ectocarpus fasciculatus]